MDFFWDEDLDMKIVSLHPAVRDSAFSMFEAFYKERGWCITIREGYVTFDEQLRRYESGRSRPGAIQSNFGPGQSMHNYGLAMDLMFLKDGIEPIWLGVHWGAIGRIGSKFGWSQGIYVGRGKKEELPHFERNFGLTTVKLRDMVRSGFVEAECYPNIYPYVR